MLNLPKVVVARSNQLCVDLFTSQDLHRVRAPPLDSL